MMQRNCSLRPDAGTIVAWPDHLPARFSMGSICGGGGGGRATLRGRTAGTGTGTTSTEAWVSPALTDCSGKSLDATQSANAHATLARFPSMQDSLTDADDVPSPRPCRAVNYVETVNGCGRPWGGRPSMRSLMESQFALQ